MHAKEIRTEEFARTVEKGIVLVDWWASWCGPCRAFAPIFEQAAAKHPDVVFAKVDTDAESGLAAAFQIRSIPTLMVFRDGILLFSQAGMLSAASLERLVADVRAIDMDEVRRRIEPVDAAVAAE